MERKTARVVSEPYQKEGSKVWCGNCKKITTFTEWLDSPGGYLTGVICDSCGFDHQQSEGIGYYNSHVYQQQCTCGKTHTLLSQDDNNPEYYTDVSVICDCGEAVRFNLPVN